MKVIKLLFLLFLALVIGVFGAHNSTYVPLSFYPFDLQISVAAFVLLFGAVLFGVIVAGIGTGAKIMHWRKLVKLKTREVAKLEKENAELRASNNNNQQLIG